ncbi:MAG: sigma-54-dependent transcriptional regulator [Acidobacteriota bacterium]
MKAQGTILIVDDEEYVRDSLATVLQRRGYLVRTAAEPAEALKQESLEGLDAVITDLRMPGGDGLQLLSSLMKKERDLPVIVLTGHGSVPSAVECMKAGAYDYVQKPAEPQQLAMILERALKENRMERELRYLRSGAGAGIGHKEPLGVSPGWREVVELAEAAAPTDSSILLLGESGVGKDEVAKLIHRKSLRATKAFVRVNCAAIPVDLFESEFFGHRKGAFTGALSDRDGRFRVAHGGTLMMDEIACMPEAAQAKVLRVLQDGIFERVGDSRPTTVDVRLIAATNCDLEEEIEAGRFRRDLYYRINVIKITLPPLRERRADIEVLAGAFLDEFASRLGKSVRGFEPDTLEILQGYDWPGNVRELRNVIERAVLLERGQELSFPSLPANLRREAPDGGEPGLNLRGRLAAEERRVLEQALQLADGVRREAARLLGIDERNLSYFLKKHSLNRIPNQTANPNPNRAATTHRVPGERP